MAAVHLSAPRPATRTPRARRRAPAPARLTGTAARRGEARRGGSRPPPMHGGRGEPAAPSARPHPPGPGAGTAAAAPPRPQTGPAAASAGKPLPRQRRRGGAQTRPGPARPGRPAGWGHIPATLVRPYDARVTQRIRRGTEVPEGSPPGAVHPSPLALLTGVPSPPCSPSLLRKRLMRKAQTFGGSF